MLYNRFNEVEVIEALAGPKAPMPTRILDGMGDKGPCILIFWQFRGSTDFWIEVYGPTHRIYKSYEVRRPVATWCRQEWQENLRYQRGDLLEGNIDPDCLQRLYRFFVDS